jgi:Flp pilus assembly protein TadB
MAQPKNKRRRKRRGTQGGRIDTKRASRPRSREEAKARARSNRSSGSSASKGVKEDLPPTWRNSALRGLAAAVIFAVLLLVIFKRPAGVALAFGAFMLAFYIPSGYYIDMALWRRRERARIRSRSE